MAQMNINDREKIEEGLKENKSFTEIGKETGFHRTTISNEVQSHRIPAKIRTYGTNNIYCEHENECTKYEGAFCTKKCSNYKLKDCKISTKPPYVCNGCGKKFTCRLQRFFYRAKDAQEAHDFDLINSRTGLNIPEETINRINKEIAPLIRDKHQTVNEVFLNHPDILTMSKSEFYRLVENGFVNIKSIDLPRQVKYRKRKKNSGAKVPSKVTSKNVKNRTYDDFKIFVSNKKPDFIVQGDTVEGKKGGKVILTLNIIQYEVMFMFLIDQQTSNEVSNKIKMIQNILGKELYSKIFKCTLLDRGKEFNEPNVFETIDNEKVCNVFYCDGGTPSQKGTCEENHHYIRYYLPKGQCDFDDLTQEDCNNMMSNIASIPREKLNGETPYEAISKVIPPKILKELGLTKVEKDDVNLSSKILNGRGKRKK